LLCAVGSALTGARSLQMCALIGAVLLTGFVSLLVRRKKLIEQARIDRLWSQDRYNEVGEARVMSLEEARRRAESIAAPVFVAPRYRDEQRNYRPDYPSHRVS
jgi:hypothetical protein